jgi:translation elongation factor EF-1alpha
MPSGTIGTVRTIEKNGSNSNVARAGDSVCVGLQNIEAEQLTSGGIICHVDFPVRVASVLELKILVLEISTPILVGFEVSSVELDLNNITMYSDFTHGRLILRLSFIYTMQRPLLGWRK